MVFFSPYLLDHTFLISWAFLKIFDVPQILPSFDYPPFSLYEFSLGKPTYPSK